jgi:hypothetical protein
MGNFAKDLKIGVKAQDFLIKGLSKELPGLKSIDGNFSNYDLVADNGYTIEVKFDRQSANTKNIGIEFEYDNQPSGIAKTKAMGWAHIFKHHDKWAYSRIKTHDLKAYIKNNWKHFRKVPGGDGRKARMVLIPVLDFMDEFSFRDINPT